jgi:hypothetical protein
MLGAMTFFDVLPPEPWDSPPSEPPALPASEGPPYGVVPGVAGLELLLAHTGRLAGYLPELIVYLDVVVLRLQLLGRRTAATGDRNRSRDVCAGRLAAAAFMADLLAARATPAE